ncbi:MAG: MGMT family protein [Candidatus Peribacteria bacterium]|jgi:methylated-DNA-[protein]-cysteine S-methyltransferase|nr:MGMT family protein [Candidatus Peribacteria bacterium]
MPRLTSKQQLVYEALLKIPKGKVITYGTLGKYLSIHPRAVGRLLSKNTEPDRYPCFKVVSYDGSLNGFAYGLEDKVKRLQADGVEIVEGKVPERYFWEFPIV